MPEYDALCFLSQQQCIGDGSSLIGMESRYTRKRPEVANVVVYFGQQAISRWIVRKIAARR
jgi:hypothetical protein